VCSTLLCGSCGSTRGKSEAVTSADIGVGFPTSGPFDCLPGVRERLLFLHFGSVRVPTMEDGAGPLHDPRRDLSILFRGTHDGNTRGVRGNVVSCGQDDATGQITQLQSEREFVCDGVRSGYFAGSYSTRDRANSERAFVPRFHLVGLL